MRRKVSLAFLNASFRKKFENHWSNASALKVKNATSSKTFRLQPLFEVEKLCCPLCKFKHVLWGCSVFTKKSVEDRVVFMRKNRFCDDCAKKGHISEFCFSPSACTVGNCTHKHHSLPHREVRQTRL